eukprot:6217003-Lingulodinium_polyedra.AAC.1
MHDYGSGRGKVRTAIAVLSGLIVCRKKKAGERGAFFAQCKNSRMRVAKALRAWLELSSKVE